MSSYSPAAVHVTLIRAARVPSGFVWLIRHARLHPERIALECDGDVLTYGDLHERAEEAAEHLRAKGVQAGDRVTIGRPPGVDFVVAFHACLLVGAAAVPLDPRLTDEERASRVRTARDVASDDVVM